VYLSLLFYISFFLHRVFSSAHMQQPMLRCCPMIPRIYQRLQIILN
jgi:hypothetical protein